MDAGAAVPALYIAGMLLFMAWQTRTRTGYPLKFDLAPQPLSGLDPAQTAALDAVAKDLEPLGFRACGDHRASFRTGGWEDSEQIEQVRFWISGDQRVVAYFRHLTFFIHSGAGNARSEIQVGFLSWSGDDRCVHSRFGRIELPIPVPGISERMVPIGPPMETVVDGHRRSCAEILGNTPPATLKEDQIAARYSQKWEREISHYERIGFLRRTDQGRAPTLLMGLWNGARSMSPFAQEHGKPWTIALRLIGAAAAALGAAWVLPRIEGNVSLPLAMVVVYAVLALACGVLFPRTTTPSWVVVAAPSYVLMAVQGWASHTIWFSGFVGAFLSAFVIERIRYGKGVARIAAGAEPAPGWTPRSRSVAAAILVLSAAMAVLSHVLTRTPMENEGWLRYLRLQTVAFLGASLLLLVVTLPLMLFQKVRRKPWYRWVKVVLIGSSLIVAGWLSAIQILRAESQVLDARGAEIVAAMRRFNGQYGTYPAGLDELYPTWLQAQWQMDDRFRIAAVTKPDGTTSTVLWYWVGMRRKTLPVDGGR